jgi:hypothetical protein
MAPGQKQLKCQKQLKHPVQLLVNCLTCQELFIPHFIFIKKMSKLLAGLKGPSGQIKSAQEWYHWVGLG